MSEYLEYLMAQALEEGFDSNFMKALKSVKKKDKDEEPDLEGDNEELQRNLEKLVQSLNKVKVTFSEKDYTKMVGNLFDKKEAKRILNHFLRKKVISGEYEGAQTIMYTLERKIEKKDIINFY